MTSLNTAVVIFYDDNGDIVAEETFTNDFFTADWFTIVEGATKWAESRKADYGAVTFSIS